MECPVCYESDFENGDLLWLRCLHPLCRRCLKKLVRKACPLCRTGIKAGIGQTDSKERCVRRTYSDSIVSTIRVRTRRRCRQRRTYVDTMDLENPRVSIIVESYENVGAFRKRTKNPNRNERDKKGRWANKNRQTRGSRHNKAR